MSFVRIHRLIWLSMGIVGSMACAQQTPNPATRVLNGPSDVAFGCIGFVGTETTSRALPPASCGPDTTPGPADAGPGQPDAGAPPDANPGDPVSASPVILVPEKGIGVLQVATLAQVAQGAYTADFVDQDPFVPGLNGLAVGRLPVAAAVTPDGCWGITSNSGSCDLTVVDVWRAATGKTDPIADRRRVTGLLGKPGEMTTLPSLPLGTSPATCNSPEGVAYVAYPKCNLVARVDLATFGVLDAIRFRQGEAPEIVSGDVTCPDDCAQGGGAGVVDGDAGPGSGGEQAEPVTLTVAPKGSQRRLTSGMVTTVDHGTATTSAISDTGVQRLFIVYVHVRESGGAVPTSALAGAGLTWTEGATVADSDSHRRLTMFYATGRANGTPITITHSAATADGTQWIVEEVLGANLDAPIVQIVTSTGTASSAAFALQQDIAGPANGVVAGFGVDVPLDNDQRPVVQTLTPDRFWTEVDELGENDNNLGTLQAQFIATPDKVPGASWQRPARYVAIAAEIELEQRLYIGAWDSPRLIAVDLDTHGVPIAVDSLPLEGTGGIRKLAASGPVDMGNADNLGTFQFVYAIGTDGAIHVADVTPGKTPVECDTQIDRRFLHDINLPARLICFPVGDPANPPRRPLADGPGIRLPNGLLPIDVAFVRAFGAASTVPTPETLRGTFATVAALGPTVIPPRGVVYLINVDDDNYPDFEQGIERRDPDIAFGLPHSLRDNGGNRWFNASGCFEDTGTNVVFGPYRLFGTPQIVTPGSPTNGTGLPGDAFAPSLLRLIPEAKGTGGDDCIGKPAIVYELSAITPWETRRELFTDVSLISGNETYTVTWEGPLGPEDFRTRKTGGVILVQGGNQLRLDVPGAGLCQLGPEPRDIVRLLGCETNGDCAVNETCYVHPEAPVGVSGMCLPRDRIIDLSAACKPLLTTVRRYTSLEIGEGHAVFVPRPRIMTESPLDGCAGADQCLAIQEKVLSDKEDKDGLAPGSLKRYAFACAVDDAIGGPAACIETCQADADCELGTACQQGRCLLGPMPPQDCVAPLQRYEFRAAGAFTVVNGSGGYLNRQALDPESGLCITDTTLSPLRTGRIHRIEPACEDTGVTSVTPNPCTLDVKQPFVYGGTDVPNCQRAAAPYDQFLECDTHAIRLRTPGLTFDVADVTVPLDGFPGVRYSPIQFGYQFRFQIAGGFTPFVETGVLANLPERIRKGWDGQPWLVDSGDAGSISGTRGQLVLIVGNASPSLQNPTRIF